MADELAIAGQLRGNLPMARRLVRYRPFAAGKVDLGEDVPGEN